MIIDSHQHLWTADYPWLADLEPIRRDYSVTDLRAVTGPAGVSHTVLVEAGLADDAETSSFLEIASFTPLIAGVVGWADLTSPDLSATIDSHRAGRGGSLLVGIRDQVQSHPDSFLDRPDVRAGLAVVASFGLVNEVVVRCSQLPSVARAAAALPSSTFVLDHLGKPDFSDFSGWRSSLALVAARPNVVAKVSGLVTEAGPGWTVAALRPYVEAALELFGPDRLMFGSDWPVLEMVATYSEVKDALVALLGGTAGPVFAGTAIRTYGLRIAA